MKISFVNRFFKLKIIGLILAFIMLTSIANAQPKKIKIGFFTPHLQNAFWIKAEKLFRAACNDFNIEIKIYHANNSRETMREQIIDAVSGQDKVDAIIFQSFKQAGESFIQIADAAKVPAFLFNAGVDHNKTGLPRGKYKYWIGEMMPSDEEAGFNLANYLIDAAIKTGNIDETGKVQMVGINGIFSDGASIERGIGLQRALNGRSDANLIRVIPGDWGFDTAKEKFLLLKKRYPQIKVVWSANDNMALGAIAGCKEMNLTVGKDIIIGGIDWDVDALKSIKTGEMSITIGGHYLDAAWAVVLLYDYFNGVDFAQESVMMKSQMHLITKSNIELFLNKLGDDEWEKVDFTKFSKKINPTIQKYNFTLEEILKQL
ncbi:MAG: ABC transporter substrate-binding protein [Desulfobacterales bacterium]|nr:ABC transporter substrate-binding protein [Desulfobacterales bacterium]